MFINWVLASSVGIDDECDSYKSKRKLRGNSVGDAPSRDEETHRANISSERRLVTAWQPGNRMCRSFGKSPSHLTYYPSETRLGIFMLGSLKPILDRLEPFKVKLEMFAHPTDYDRFPVCSSSSLLLIYLLGEFIEDGSRRRFRRSAGRQESSRLSRQVKSAKISVSKF